MVGAKTSAILRATADDEGHMTAKHYLLAFILAGMFEPCVLGQVGIYPHAASTPNTGSHPASEPGVSSLLLPPPPVTPTQTLTNPTHLSGFPNSVGSANSAYPPGTVTSPWCGDGMAGRNCNGPVGGNGPIAYDLYLYTGPSLIVGGDPEISAALKNGWMVGGGTRTLFMNQAGDAAWALDFGISYTFTRGNPDRFVGVATPPPPNPATGVVDQPEQINTFTVRNLHRTAFNFAIGRDWWLNGPGFVGGECDFNQRIGFDVGGRWGNSHIQLIPRANPETYLRRDSLYHGIFLSANWNFDVPMGAWILFGGTRLQWGYNWTNVVPPIGGDLQDVNILFQLGTRF